MKISKNTENISVRHGHLNIWKVLLALTVFLFVVLLCGIFMVYTIGLMFKVLAVLTMVVATLIFLWILFPKPASNQGKDEFNELAIRSKEILENSHEKAPKTRAKP